MVVKESFYVGYSDINKEMALSNASILKIFENMACIHGALCGESIKTCPIRWFLTGYEVNVIRRPEIEERVLVHTWSREMRGVSACREFEIYGEDGTLCVTGISNWARTNAVTQRLERATPDIAAKYESEPNRTNFEKTWLEKLSEPSEYTSSRKFTVERNHIDVNDHMNNVFYLDAAKLALPEEVYALPESKRFKIMYRQAIKYGETVDCLYAETETSHIITLKDENGVARSIIEFAK